MIGIDMGGPGGSGIVIMGGSGAKMLGPRQVQWCRAKLIHDGAHIFSIMEGSRDDDRRAAEAISRASRQKVYHV